MEGKGKSKGKGRDEREQISVHWMKRSYELEEKKQMGRRERDEETN